MAGRNFLYVYGEEYFEVSFPADHFLHLTGVETMLSAKNFYKNAKKRTLGSKQFYFTKRHPYATAKKKLSIIYKLSVTNLEFTLGLMENTDDYGKKVNDLYLPMSLRVEDSSVEKSAGGEVVDFIFSKDASVAKYDTLLVRDERKEIPECVRHLLSADLLKESRQTID